MANIELISFGGSNAQTFCYQLILNLSRPFFCHQRVLLSIKDEPKLDVFLLPTPLTLFVLWDFLCPFLLVRC